MTLPELTLPEIDLSGLPATYYIIGGSAVILLIALLEWLVKPILTRIAAIVLILFGGSVVAGKLGIDLGKEDLLDQLVQSLPEALSMLDQTKDQPQVHEETLRVLKDAASDTTKLKDFEDTLKRLRSEDGPVPEAPFTVKGSKVEE